MTLLAISKGRVFHGLHAPNLRSCGTPLYRGGTPQTFLKMSFNDTFDISHNSEMLQEIHFHSKG
jgi:hypothetical protein